MEKSGLSGFCSHVTRNEKMLDSGTKLSRVVKTLGILILLGSCMQVGKSRISVLIPEGDK